MLHMRMSVVLDGLRITLFLIVGIVVFRYCMEKKCEGSNALEEFAALNRTLPSAVASASFVSSAPDGVCMEMLWWSDAIYLTASTISTVGYGDIVAHTQGEMIFCFVAQLLGVMLFGPVTSRHTTLTPKPRHNDM